MALAKTIRDNLATIVAGAIVLAILVTSWGLVLFSGVAARAIGGSHVAIVHDGEGNVHEIPLSQDAEVSIETSLGTNVICVRNGEASIVEADCPKRECMAQHPISHENEQLICLPHKLWVEIAPAGTAGGDMNIDAVIWDDGDQAHDFDTITR